MGLPIVRPLLAAGAAVALLASPAAHATTVLSTTLASITCGITDASGVTRAQACVSLSSGGAPDGAIGFVATLQPGDIAFVNATLDYRYHDDGWVVDPPRAFQMDPNGFLNLPVDREAAALLLFGNNCGGSRYCAVPPDLSYGGSTGFPPVILGLNDHPDDLSGRLTWSSSVSVTGPGMGVVPTHTVTAYVRWFDVAYSGVAPVPEPATGATLLAGLALLGAVSRRRSRG